MRALTQLFYLLPCKAGAKVVFSRTDPTSESPFRLGSSQLLLEAKAVSKCLPRASKRVNGSVHLRDPTVQWLVCACLVQARKSRGHLIHSWFSCYGCRGCGAQALPSLLTLPLRKPAEWQLWIHVVACLTLLIKASPHCVVSSCFPASLQRLHISD